MFFMLIPPACAFYAPIVKVPFLLANGIFTFRGFTAPGKPPSTRERQKAEPAPGIALRYPIVHKVLHARRIATKYFFCGISFVEVALILGHHLSWSYSAYIPPSMLPFVQPRSLRLTPLSVAGCVLGIAGGLLRTQCYRELRRLFTYELSIRDNHKLVTTGPYPIVRHPAYLGAFLFLTGNVALLASKGSWFMESGLWDTVWGRGVGYSALGSMLLIALRLFLRVDEEDRMMKKEFGEEWEKWAKKTPYRLIPFVY
ncbi:hypothetical protein V8D89_003434 [Ganoderma adspersum]